VEAFVDLMNIRARELGMHDTEFHSVHGLPPGLRQKPDLTSAHDMALLARELIRHPLALEWASTETAPFRGGEFILYNPNKLIGTYRGLDGLKTGYHGKAGFCVTATAVQKGKRLISVVMGAPTDQARATETTRLLSYGFNLYKTVTLIQEGRVVLEEKLQVKGGKQGEVVVACEGPLEVIVPRHRVASVVVEHRLPADVQAPLVTGQEVGKAVALLRGRVLGEVPIVVMEDVAEGNWFDRLFH
jgi:D-alanyl-D-alanine carboxypeptidase (penicillin-binding protein 5/6)